MGKKWENVHDIVVACVYLFMTKGTSRYKRDNKNKRDCPLPCKLFRARQSGVSSIQCSLSTFLIAGNKIVVPVVPISIQVLTMKRQTIGSFQLRYRYMDLSHLLYMYTHMYIYLSKKKKIKEHCKMLQKVQPKKEQGYQ